MFTIVVGIFLVGLGIAMLRGFEPTVRLPKLEMGADSRELTSMFLYGISYAVASLSCTIPIYVGIVATTLERTSVASGKSNSLRAYKRCASSSNKYKRPSPLSKPANAPTHSASKS